MKKITIMAIVFMLLVSMSGVSAANINLNGSQNSIELDGNQEYQYPLNLNLEEGESINLIDEGDLRLERVDVLVTHDGELEGEQPTDMGYRAVFMFESYDGKELEYSASMMQTLEIGDFEILIKEIKDEEVKLEISKENEIKSEVRRNVELDGNQEYQYPLNLNLEEGESINLIDEGDLRLEMVDVLVTHDGELEGEQPTDMGYRAVFMFESYDGKELEYSASMMQTLEIGDFEILIKEIKDEEVKLEISKENEIKSEVRRNVELEKSDDEIENDIKLRTRERINSGEVIKISKNAKGEAGSSNEIKSVRMVPGNKRPIIESQSGEKIESDTNGKGISMRIKSNNAEQVVRFNSTEDLWNTMTDEKQVKVKTRKTFVNDEEGLGIETANGTKRIKVLPSQASDRAKEVLTEIFGEIEIKEEKGKIFYDFEEEKKVKILGFIPKKAKFSAQVDAETGELIKSHKPWFASISSKPMPSSDSAE